MAKLLISVDPGKSSGLAALGYDDSGVWLEDAHQASPGVGALIQLVKDVDFGWGGNKPTWISEKFIPRPGGGFGQSLDSTLPLVGEGALIALGLMPEYSPGEKRWRAPQLQYIVGGEGLADKRKRQHKFLKDSGFYRTGKDLGAPDADDFRSACAHGLAYLARGQKHMPSFELISGWVEENPA